MKRRRDRKERTVYVDEDVWAGEVIVWADIVSEEEKGNAHETVEEEKA